ncbi:MAG: prepilin-type N-terminal cleavage/methylation domain-containing protein [bacterium]|nr:prepilin-type N-terminal cleavage/methylation domain-containing protein [bacterium]
MFKKGFTLIELLVVVALIGVLTTLVMANLNAGRERSRDAQRKSDLRSMATALRLYYNDKGAYPANNVSGQIMGCGSGGVSACSWGAEWLVGTTTYMSKLADDPIPGRDYKYEVGSDTDTFTLSSCLENTSDDKGAATSDTTWCPSGWMYQLKP